MGKKGSWFSSIKRIFISNSKEKSVTLSDGKSSREKKKGRGILRSGEAKSFIPIFKEPSSIEKILCEADEQKLLTRPPPTSEQPKTLPLLPLRPSTPILASSESISPKVTSPRTASPSAASPRFASPRIVSPRVGSPRVASPQAASPRVLQQRKEIDYSSRPEPNAGNQHLAATRIQASYRGYAARRSFRALRGLVSLQGLVRGQNVKQQTTSALKSMQFLVRIQTQIQLRRIQMLEKQAFQHQVYKHDMDVESTLSKWTRASEAGHEEWDDSLLKKEEKEARLQKKVEAVIKRERAMAYGHSHQLWKESPQSALKDARSNGFPWWWTWLDRHLSATNVSVNQSTKSVQLIGARPSLEHKPSPKSQSSNYKQHPLDSHEVDSLRSLKSPVPLKKKQMHTPSRTPPPNSSSPIIKRSKARTGATDLLSFDVPLKDDDSLMSCPPFSVPNYMSPTFSAKAKVRVSSSPKEKFPAGTPTSDSKRRFSFPPTPNVGSSRVNKGSGKDSASLRVPENHQSVHSIGDLSVDSTVSMPAAVGRKPFNRFV